MAQEHHSRDTSAVEAAPIICAGEVVEAALPQRHFLGRENENSTDDAKLLLFYVNRHGGRQHYSQADPFSIVTHYSILQRVQFKTLQPPKSVWLWFSVRVQTLRPEIFTR